MDRDPRTSSRPSRSDAPGALRIVALDAAGGPVDCASLDDLAVLAADSGVRFWLDAQRPDAAALERISAILDLHPLVTEDVSERNERPKIVALDGALHLVLFALA